MRKIERSTKVDWPYALSDSDPWDRQLSARFRESLLRFFRRRTQDSDDAEDLVQDVMVRLLNRPPWHDAQPAEAYVFTVAANILRDRARKILVRENSGASPMPADPVADQVIDNAPGPDRILSGRVDVAKLAKAMEEMSPKTRSILILCRWEHMSRKEVAKQLGISVSAVEKHLSKALCGIARHLSQ